MVNRRLGLSSPFTVDLKGMTMRLVRRFTLAVATTALVIYSSGIVRSDETPATGVWTMEITPAANRHAAPASVLVADPPAAAAPNVDPAEYQRIYNSIPFSRAEYLANRDYRHAATMEILFGQLRPTTIVKTVAPATETRTSYTHQSYGRPGSISPPVWNSPMMWNSWTW